MLKRMVSLVVVAAFLAAGASGCRRRTTIEASFLTNKAEQVTVQKEGDKTTLIKDGQVVAETTGGKILAVPSPASPGGFAYVIEEGGKSAIFSGNGSKVADCTGVVSILGTQKGPVAVTREGNDTVIVTPSGAQKLPGDVAEPIVQASENGSVAAVGYPRAGGERMVIKDGEIVDRAGMVGEWALSPNGESLAYAVCTLKPDQGKAGEAAVGAGKGGWIMKERKGNRPSEVGAPGQTYEGIAYPVYSPDSQKLVFAVKYEPKAGEQTAPTWTMVWGSDGSKIGESYNNVGKAVFSADSSSIAFPASVQANKWTVILNGKPTDGAYDSIQLLQFSPDGKDLVYAGQQDRRWFVIRNGHIYSSGAGYDAITEIVLLPDKIVFIGWRSRIGQKYELTW